MSAASSGNGDPPGNFFPIAVVGIGCRMPGDVNNPEDFWRVIRDGRDVVDDILPERWNVDHYHDPDHTQTAKHCMRRIGMIKDIDTFDNSFFKISPREAVSMDPQQRHLLEVTHEAFEDAGILSDELGTDGGVFVGIGLFDYSIYITDPYLMDAYVLTGNAHSCAANRLSFAFDIKGPSYACDTACASGLTALHLAASALWNKECSTAVVGACNAILIPEVAIGFSQLGVVSADGMSCPFSKSANGYVRSEGWGSMILKPLDKALQDNDHVYCTIHGSAIAANGNYNSLTMPSPTAQQYVMGQTYERFGIDRSEVSYVEAHGTGTPVGDPIEAKAIGLTFASYRDAPLKIGSVKSNFGHQECCSGIASAIKVALMLDKKMLCPTINYQGINPEIDLQNLKLEIQQSLEPILPNSNFTIGLNSFGFAGALAHMVLREAPDYEVCNDRQHGSRSQAGWRFGGSSKGEYVLIPLTARSVDAVTDLARRWLKFDHKNDALSVVSWLASRRKHYECKLAILANSSQMFRERLQVHINEGSGEGIFTGSNYGTDVPKICFVFPGQGQQWANMGRRLYYTEEVFRGVVDKCDMIFRQLSGWSVLADKDVFNGIHSGVSVQDEFRSDEVVNEMEVGQPVILFFQLGLYELLNHWGIHPDVCVGHSLGEVAAAYACGGLTLEESVAVIYHRSQQQVMLKGTGSMAAVRLSLLEAKAMCSKYHNLHIAAINAPSNITVAGSTRSIQQVCQENPSLAKQLRVQCSFHSPDMEPMERPFRKAMDGAVLTQGRFNDIPFYSSAFGKKYDGVFSTDYWWANIRGCVQFQDAVEKILDEVQPVIFLEIASSATLISSVNQIASVSKPGKITSIACGKRKQDDRLVVLQALATLYTSGVKIDWKNITHDTAQWLRLPTYPWQKQSYWIEAENKKNTRLVLTDPTFKTANGCVSLEEFPFLSDHVVQDKVIFPGAGYISYILQMCMSAEQPFVVKKINFVKVLVWPEKVKKLGEKTRVQLSFETRGVVVSITGDKHKVCDAEIDDIKPHPKHRLTLPVDDILKTCAVSVSAENLYSSFAEVGLKYGPAFQVIDRIVMGDREAVGYLKPAQKHGQCLDVTTLDGCFQVLLAAVRQTTTLYLPVHVQSLQMFVSHMPLGLPLLIHAKITECDSWNVVGDVTLTDQEGVILVKVLGCQCKNVSGTRSTVDLETCLYAIEWQPSAACLPSTSLMSDIFHEHYLRNHFPDEMDAVDKGEDKIDVFRRASLSYIRHALREVPENERGICARYSCHLQSSAASNEESFPLEDIPHYLDDVSRSAPDTAIECAMIRAMGENLPNCLRNPLSSLNLLFSFLEDYFNSASSINIYYKAIIDLLSKSVLELSKKKKVIRILEVGARVGGFARLLLDNLKCLGVAENLQYIFTDISQSFFPRARANLQDYPQVKYKVFDFQQDPEAQGLVPGSVDILISLDALHSAVDLHLATENLRSLLGEGGWLLVMETTKGNYCQELIFGSLEMCWTYQDFRTNSCWMSQHEWVELLRRSGFDSVVGCSTPSEYFHSVMLGCKSSTSSQKELTTSIGGSTPGHHWILISDTSQEMLNQQLKHHLGPPQQDVRHSSDTDYSTVLQRTKHPVDVVYIWGPADGKLHCLLRLMQAVAQKSDIISRFWVVTEGACIECHNTSAQLVVGFARAASNQLPVPVICLDLDPNSWIQEKVAHLSALILNPNSPEREIAVRSGELRVPRLMPVKTQDKVVHDSKDKYWSLEPEKYNDAAAGEKGTTVKHVGFMLHSEMQVNAAEVLVKVKAAALNFKDVMVSLGMLDELILTEDRPQFGLECAGTVHRVGSEVTRFQVGDEVLGFGTNCFASHAVCKSQLLVKKPSRANWVEAAGIGMVFVTAYYCLIQKAKLQEGEKVLIHSACGGVGLAAIQIAKMVGAEIIATAGTKEKRKYLQDTLGLTYVTDSRSDQFYTDVMRWTGGQGVDVILNSLAGKLLHKGFALLKPEGRFCEIGKRDILQNSTLQMSPLMNNVSFLSCQIDALMQSNPSLVGTLLEDVICLIEHERLHPVPTQVCDMSSFSDAFKTMAKGTHIGKYVFEVMPDFQIPADHLIPSTKLFKSSVTYLITGGYGGIGQAMARWLAANGARHIALVSRTGPSTASSRSTISYLQKHGIHTYQLQCDLSDQLRTSHMLTELRRMAPPLGGVFHLAGVIADESLDTLSPQDLDAIIDSKATSARNLHSLTLSDDLDVFFLLSSVCATWAHASQPGYVAANAYLDALAVHRYQHGLPALSVQLGPIRGAGYLEGKPEVAKIFASKGNKSLHVVEFLKMLQRLIETGYEKPVICLANQDWSTTMQFCHSSSMKFRHLAGCGPTHSPGTSAVEKTVEDVEGALKEKLAELLFVSANSIDIQQPMINYGVDSLMAVEVVTWAATTLNVSISQLDVLSGITTAELLQKACQD
ncbi:hybrid PKS-NRPS synthetase pytA-like [Patiria miniata]|uniref:Carrier domain-containing protein n=1 Tax=Patiria miniata TaxID=46514 RepID=A0A914AEW5_PATMI|nr:hybrid PKS-NRPS synthetase pytA-like [Patiria miniata]